MQYFQIGDIVFSWNNRLIEMTTGGFIERFYIAEEQIPKNAEWIDYKTELFDLRQYKNSKCLTQNSLYELYDTAKGRLLIYHWNKQRFAYGFFLHQLEEKDQVTVMFSPDFPKEYPLQAERFFSTVGMHSKILERGGVILHAAYIGNGDRAILFTAPSQTGKSTQAGLWQQYADAEIINGDRVLLRKREGIWHAYGYPSCGSSSICLNRTLPVEAIIILEQGMENRIEQLRSADKIRALVAGIEVYTWDQKEVETSIFLASEIVQSVPVIRLVCRPDKEAVQVLKDYLEGV